VVEYLLGTIIKKLLKSDVSMWDPFKTSKMRVSIVDALSTSKREMIFIQPLYYNFLTTFSLILTLYSYSLSSFFSLYCFGPMRREKMKVVNKVVTNGCIYITTHFLKRPNLSFLVVPVSKFESIGRFSHQVFASSTISAPLFQVRDG
jgi:hypothetical protein